MQEEFDMIASEEQIEKMNEEFRKLGAQKKTSQSRVFVYPLPVYTTDKCARFCRCSNAVAKIISLMDAVFVSRNEKVMAFIVSEVSKNKIYIAQRANITQEVFVGIQRMPIKQSMYKLLELHNEMSMILSELSVYDNSAQMQNIILKHVLWGSVLHGICI